MSEQRNLEDIKKNFFWAGVILYNPAADSVLMQKRDDKAPVNPGLWGLFGGVGEKGETPEECIVREVHEEIGVKIDPILLKPLLDYLHTLQMIWRYTYAMIFDVKKSAMTLHEGEDFEWVPCTSILSYPLTPNTQKDIEFFLSQKSTYVRK